MLIVMGLMSKGQDQGSAAFSPEESIGMTPKMIKKKVAKSRKNIEIIFKTKSGKSTLWKSMSERIYKGYGIRICLAIY